ncbi:hypothetical protein GCM10008960_23820 [Deinococcus sedimenti]|uniref:Uncharacterized protein n=1 Tax=Deinococcus sedimenti TaxID=1867090 RepID=A0ABQ2S4M4_9DEIO|nr:hypothetical protein GCM10008960_23820 [Deinococcus sedimenti]
MRRAAKPTDVSGAGVKSAAISWVAAKKNSTRRAVIGSWRRWPRVAKAAKYSGGKMGVRAISQLTQRGGGLTGASGW